MHKNSKTVAETLSRLFLQLWYFYSWLNLIRCSYSDWKTNFFCRSIIKTH